MTDITATTANLDASERAFLLDTGERVAVRITRGAQTEEYVAMKIQSRLITEAGETVIVGQTPAVTPARVVTLNAAGLADGAITVEGEMATATIEACERARVHAAALQAWTRIPPGA